MDWVVTIPKTIKWATYQKEVEEALIWNMALNYKTRYFPKDMRVGDRCFVVHDGKVRGWMVITGLVESYHGWVCETTGKDWPAGLYIQRSGVFHCVDGPDMLGFRGVRKFNSVSIRHGD